MGMLQQSSTPNNTAVLTVMATTAVQIVSILSVLLIVLRYDGSTETTVIQALLAFMVPNALAGGAVAVAHVITGNRAAAAEATAQAAAPAPAPAPIPAATLTPAQIIQGS